MATTPILFIGPIRAGKSTLAKLLSELTGLPNISLDELREKYYGEIGYDADLARQIRAEGGFLALVFYRQLFETYSVEKVLSDYPQAIINFGAGVGPYENQIQIKRVQALFEPIPNIFLLLPSPDIAESLKILRQRDPSPPGDLHFDINAHFVGHPGYYQLAKQIIYTKHKTPEQSCAEVIALLK